MPDRLPAFGYNWIVKNHTEEPYGPGPNYWNTKNVTVSDDGYVNLQLKKRSGRWICAELKTEERFGYGTYTWQIDGPLGKLDDHVAFGLFNYPPPEIGPDGTNEIDIEIAKFPHLASSMLVYGVFPTSEEYEREEKALNIKLDGNYTTHRFHWTPGRVAFRSWHGHAPEHEDRVFAAWAYEPAEAIIPQRPLPVHMNLWLIEGAPPTDDQAVSITIKDFTFEPMRNVVALHEMQRNYIAEVLEFTAWRIEGAGGAADILGIPASSLRDTIKKLRIKQKK